MSGWEKYVRNVSPYIPGEQPRDKNLIKLNTNENPYPPSPKVEEFLRGFDYRFLRKYPEPNVSELRAALAKYHAIESDMVFVGVGSDDVLGMSFLTFFNSKKPVLFADITYSFYDVWAELFGISYKKVPLKDDFTLDVSDYCIENGGIVIANPNAPTGLALGISDIRRVLDANRDSVVIVDEAYVDFGAESALPLIREYDNLLVCRTFSKSRALAGSRIGYAMGGKKLISCLLAVRNSYNSYTIDSVSGGIALAAISDDAYFKDGIEKIIKTRERTKEKLRELGFSFPDSKANFVFASHKDKKAADIYEKLRAKSIYVRYFNKPGIDNYLRITIGTDEEMDALFAALSEIL